MTFWKICVSYLLEIRHQSYSVQIKVQNSELLSPSKYTHLLIFYRNIKKFEVGDAFCFTPYKIEASTWNFCADFQGSISVTGFFYTKRCFVFFNWKFMEIQVDHFFFIWCSITNAIKKKNHTNIFNFYTSSFKKEIICYNHLLKVSIIKSAILLSQLTKWLFIYFF